MNHREGSNIYNIFSVLGANFFVMFVGISQSLLFPKLMGPSQYGYWSLYLLYISYAGFFNLGVTDGIYLLFGGKDYEQLEKEKFKAYLIIIFIYLSLFLFIWLIYSFYIYYKTPQMLIMIYIGFSSFFACLINYIVMINQATSRFNIYSKGHIIEKISIIFGAIILIKWKIAFVPMVASIIGRFITLIFYYTKSKDILFAKHSSLKEALKDISKFFSVGIWITLAATGTTAMSGIGRFFIQYQLGVIELGYYSFILSLAGLFTIFFSAIATVLFPMFKRSIESTYRNYTIMLDNLLDWFGILILLLYFPAKYILAIMYPQYEPALKALVLLFPLVLLQGRISMIYSTIYKVERLERQYVYNLIISIAVCVIAIIISLKIKKDITSVALATYISFVFWCIINVLHYNKKSVIKLQYHFVSLIISIIFIIINLLDLPNIIAVILTYCICIPYAIFSTVKVIPSVKQLRSYLKESA